jgi:hypothetical protein
MGTSASNAVAAGHGCEGRRGLGRNGSFDPHRRSAHAVRGTCGPPPWALRRTLSASFSARIRPVGEVRGQIETILTTAPDFETGRQQLEDHTPEGWHRLHVIVDRDE